MTEPTTTHSLRSGADAQPAVTVDEARSEIARVDALAIHWWETAANYAERLLAVDLLMNEAVLSTNEADDNIAAVVPIDVWRRIQEQVSGV